MKTRSLLTAAAVLATLPAFAQAAASGGHPDFTGAWVVTPYASALKPADGGPIPLKPEAKAVYDQHQAALAKGDKSWDPVSECLPEGLPRIMNINEPFEILQRDKAMYFIAQNRVPWRAYFGEQIPADADPDYMGYSVAKWDGPALVVDSGEFRDITMLDDKGLPHSEKLHLTQTFRMGADGKTMTVTYRVEDPDTFTKPWTAKATFVKKPAGFQMPEEVCAEKMLTTAPKR